MHNEQKKLLISVVITSIIVSSLFGGVVGFWAGAVSRETPFSLLKGSMFGAEKVVKVEEESSVISAVEKVSPAVVSIIISKDLPIIEEFRETPPGSDFFRQFFGDDFGLDFNTPQFRQNGTEKREIGGGSGFIISSDGYVVTNRHVVSDESADYTVLTNSGKKYPAKVLARDAVNDLAVLKVDASGLPAVEFGDSASLKAGQSVIAIGNALGEFRNTVSVGVISGLARSVVASGGLSGSEQLSNVIQTDASINPGNSGGPLLNLAGQVIGINTAIVAGAQNIGFALPINEVKSSIESVRQTGKIVRPWLGVRYVLIDDALAETRKLAVKDGALVIKGENENEPAVISGSPADKAGLKENDIILELDGTAINESNPLANALGRFKPGDEVTLKIRSGEEEKEVKVRLEELK
ncbi:MAG: trypsin-like peptidase domain-containing protein [Patescibacteria group bacterium]|jgi:S1-C subfamily serine protease